LESVSWAGSLFRPAFSFLLRRGTRRNHRHRSNHRHHHGGSRSSWAAEAHSASQFHRHQPGGLTAHRRTNGARSRPYRLSLPPASSRCRKTTACFCHVARLKTSVPRSEIDAALDHCIGRIHAMKTTALIRITPANACWSSRLHL